MDGAGLQAWLDFEMEAMLWGIDPDISREELVALIEGSTMLVYREEHRNGHEMVRRMPAARVSSGTFSLVLLSRSAPRRASPPRALAAGPAPVDVVLEGARLSSRRAKNILKPCRIIIGPCATRGRLRRSSVRPEERSATMSWATRYLLTLSAESPDGGRDRHSSTGFRNLTNASRSPVLHPAPARRSQENTYHRLVVYLTHEAS
jgi:hypothetical protein